MVLRDVFAIVISLVYEFKILPGEITIYYYDLEYENVT